MSNLRRLSAWLLIAQQFLAGSGVPLPVRAAAAHDERYPCENCGCGCASAEQCWRQCCCYTNRQKVAWAREHGVAVPDYVLAAAEREAAPKPKCPHCAAKDQPQSGPSSPGCDPGGRERGKDRPSKPRGFCWVDVMRCRGLAAYWQAAGVSWPGDPPVRMCVILPPAGRAEPLPFFKDLFSPPAPPTPPPKV